MKQPVFTLPNSLTILKKYKKQSGNKNEDNKEISTGAPQGLLMLSQNGANGNQQNLVLPQSGAMQKDNNSLNNVLSNLDQKPLE